MNITNTTPKQTFGAKFANTETLHNVVKYAIENNKFDKLNKSRKEIEKQDFFVKVAVDLVKNPKTGKDVFRFTRYIPKHTNENGIINTTYLTNVYEREATKKNSIKELYDLLVKMSACAPENKLYRHIVRGK